MNTRLRSLIRKEFIQFFRDRALVFLVLYIFMEIALCGWALFLDVKNLPMAVYDLDRSAESRKLIEQLRSVENFEIKYFLTKNSEINELMDEGLIHLALFIPPDYSSKLAEGLTGKVQLIADGSNSLIATTALGYAAQVIGNHSIEVEMERLGVDQGIFETLPVIRNSINVLYDPELKFTHFNLLAMVAIAALFIGVLLAAGAIVREKEAGTLEQLLVTPITSWELILAKILPMGIIKMAGLGVGVLISVFVFDVPVKGSLILFFSLSTLLFFAAMGFGVYLATFAKNMQQALLLCFFGLFPIMFLSGTVVPISSMPWFLRAMSYLSPLRHYIKIVLGIFLKGVGLEALWEHTIFLALFGLIIFALSIRRFNKGLG